MTFAFRDMEVEDRHFVVDAWCRSYQFAHAAGIISVDTWFSVMIPQVERILDRPDARTIVAHKADETDRLADLQGFIIVDTAELVPVVFYVFVKEAYRKAGRARGLFGAAGVDPAKPFFYVCTTGVVSRVYNDRKIPLARYDPLIARFPKDDPRRPRRTR